MADKMPGRAAQAASSILGAIRHAPPNRPAPDAQVPCEVIAVSLIGGLVIGP
jgi:hypothetical protein